MAETPARNHVLLLAGEGREDAQRLVALLEAQHYKVRRVTSLASAKLYLESVEVRAFILDPHVNGVGVSGVREVAAAFPSVALVALVNRGGEYTCEQCLDGGAHDCLVRDDLSEHQLRRVIPSEEGGEVDFETEQGKGTTFSVALAAADSLALTIPAPPPAMEDEEVSRARVLVIDDDPLIVKSIRRMLGRTHEVTCHTRATAALELLHRGERFDVILCDLMMPEMTGIEFFKALRATMPAYSERVVFLTGGAFTVQACEFMENVPNQRLDKPFHPTALRALVENCLRHSAPVCGAEFSE